MPNHYARGAGSASRETVETVSCAWSDGHTPLKRGVNEMQLAGPQKLRCAAPRGPLTKSRSPGVHAGLGRAKARKCRRASASADSLSRRGAPALEFGRFRTGCSGFRIACRSGNSSNPSAGRQMTKETLFLQALIDKELSPKCLKSSPKGFDSSAQGNALGTRSPDHYQP